MDDHASDFYGCFAYRGSDNTAAFSGYHPERNTLPFYPEDIYTRYKKRGRVSMDILLDVIIILLGVALLIIEIRKHHPVKEKKIGIPSLVVDVEMAEEDVTPTLIQSLLSSNLAMKRKMITVIEDGDMDGCIELQNQIICNDDFILQLFDFDEKVRSCLHEKDDKKTEKDISSLKEGMIRKQQRLDV